MDTEKRVTIKDIAKEVGVSPRTVSLALNNQGRISEAVRQRIMETAQRMNYRPNMLARGLVKGRTYLLGFACPAVHESFFSSILSGIEEKCAAMNYDVILGNTLAQDMNTEKRTITRMMDRKVDGIISVPDPRAYAVYEPLVSSGFPFVQVMTRVPGLAAPTLLVDNEYGGYLAASHLVGLGHKRIGFLHTPVTYYEEIALRYKGYTKALLEAGCPVDIDSLTGLCDNLIDIENAQKSTVQLLSRTSGITAVFAPTDHAAIGAINACISLGLRVPDDVSVIGYDDMEVARHQMLLPLTTIAQPKIEMGWKAFEMLEHYIQKGKPANDIIKPRLVVRATTACAPASR